MQQDLKKNYLLAIPGLIDINLGKEVLFMFENELCLAVEKYTEKDDENSTLKKAAQIIRTSIKNEEQNFDGYFSEDCQVHKYLYGLFQTNFFIDIHIEIWISFAHL